MEATALPSQVSDAILSSHLQVIEDAQHHAKTHVDDPDDNRHLHLVGVEEGQPVYRHVPYLTGHRENVRNHRKTGAIVLQRGRLSTFTHRIDAERVGPAENAADVWVQREQSV